MEKKCSKCQCVKDTSEFYNSSATKDGLRSQCKSCIKQYRVDNRDKIATYNKQYHLNNRGDALKRMKQYRLDNLEEMIAYNKQYRVDNRDKIATYNKQYRFDNSETISACKEQWYIDNRDSVLAQQKQRKIDLKDCGLCIHCGDTLMKNSTICCEVCWLKHKSSVSFGTVEHYLFLGWLLEDQGFRCAYTGKKLIAGINASVDHIKPRLTHPELISHPNNVCWCDLSTNKQKKDIPVDQFIAKTKG